MSLVPRRAGAPRRTSVVLVCLALAALPVLSVRHVADPSPWLHLKVGEFLLDGGRFGLPDPWAPYAARAYVPTQWLPSMVAAVGFDHFGTAFIVWARVVGIGLLSLTVLAWASRLARPLAALAVGVCVIAASWPSLTERPQTLGFVLLVPVCAAWTASAEDLRPRWWVVPVTWVAAACHGIWVMGTVVGGAVALGLLLQRGVDRRSVGSLLAVLAASVAAAGLTPVGPRLLLTPFQVSGQGRQFVAEWMPSSVRTPQVLLVLAMVAGTWLCWLATRRRPEPWRLLLLLGAVALTLTTKRTVPVGALVALPLLCDALERTLVVRGYGTGSRWGRGALPSMAAAALVGLVAAMPVARSLDDTPGPGIPAKLESALHALPRGTGVLAESDLTGWLLYTAPQLSPAYDLRVESYTAQQVEDYISVMAAEPGWSDYLGVHDVEAALLHDDSPLLDALVSQRNWTQLGSDAGYALVEAPR